MKCFAAHDLCPGSGQLLMKQVVCLDDEGRVCSIRRFENEMASTVFLNGVLCPAFGLPGSNGVMTLDEAASLLLRITRSNPDLPVSDFLEFYVDVPDLTIGSTPVLWCIDPIDLKKGLLLENSSVYSVFP
ncbi:MAG: hypothetical protein PHS30_05170 [Bacteroidales bacterium]|nr:hypothetical protein [Bacteroidales bacterium]